jgi:hypothetical protein
VLPISTVIPARLFMMSPGLNALPEMAHGQFRRHDHGPERHGGGGAGHVLLHQRHVLRRLDVEPAGIEANALSDKGHLGAPFIAPNEARKARLS